jgi:hypothetical protein
MWRGTVPLGSLRPDKFVYFTSYDFVGLVLPLSFFMLLENYDLQLHHLSSHSITLVAIFMHLCEMYVSVQPSVCLF